MSYATDKGSEGEREFAAFLNETFAEFGFGFLRIGGTEKGKKLLAGDVILDTKTDPDSLCVLRNYFLEAKKRGVVQVFDEMEKAEDDARQWGKWGAIGYFVKQGRGHPGRRVICMTPSTFRKLVSDLQRSSSKPRN